ncbi:MAG: hypothetical protein DMG97_31370 [Acidobacteria bacterium]|nr:MAG: hypothetical protein DMG97_31370 [Acidobacteriota bacterium]
MSIARSATAGSTRSVPFGISFSSHVSCDVRRNPARLYYSPTHGPRTARMDRARQMLASERTVTDVCFEIGYESLGSFSTKFRAQFGLSPKTFQREMRRIFGYSAPWRVLMVPACFLQAWAVE